MLQTPIWRCARRKSVSCDDEHQALTRSFACWLNELHRFDAEILPLPHFGIPHPRYRVQLNAMSWFRSMITQKKNDNLLSIRKLAELRVPHFPPIPLNLLSIAKVVPTAIVSIHFYSMQFKAGNNLTQMYLMLSLFATLFLIRQRIWRIQPILFNVHCD